MIGKRKLDLIKDSAWCYNSLTQLSLQCQNNLHNAGVLFRKLSRCKLRIRFFNCDVRALVAQTARLALELGCHHISTTVTILPSTFHSHNQKVRTCLDLLHPLSPF